MVELTVKKKKKKLIPMGNFLPPSTFHSFGTRLTVGWMASTTKAGSDNIQKASVNYGISAEV